MRFLHPLPCVLLFLFLFCVQLPGQEAVQTTGIIAGTVTDNTGAVIPGASVKVKNAQGVEKEAVVDEKGEYEFKELAPGTYSLKITVPGMKDFEPAAVVLAAGQTSRIDAVMVPASVTGQVNVEGQTVTQVETETAQIVGTITQQEVTSVGLNGRNFTQLAALAPGVSNQTGQDEALLGIKGSVKYSVNGGRVEYNTFDIDGGDVLNPLNAQTTTLVVYPSLDAIQELQVLTSNYGAMYGRSASGTILATTKSGGSDFHGNGYFFARNNIFNDRNYFDETAHAPTYQKYDPGGTIGGPIYIPNVYNTKKDKTFFFFSEEYRHDKEPTEFNQGVPSAQERDCTLGANPNVVCTLSRAAGIVYGDFSDVCPAAESSIPFTRTAKAKSSTLPFAPDCPGTPTGLFVNGFPTYSTFFDNFVNVRPDPSLSGVPFRHSEMTAPFLLLGTGIIPLPNATTGCNSSIPSCYDTTISPLTTWRQELFRIDHNFSTKVKGSFRFIHDSWTTDSVTPLYAYIANSFPTIENHVQAPGISMIAHLSQTVSTTFVNDVAISFTADHIRLTDIAGPGANLTRPAGLDTAMTALFNNGFGGKLPGLVIGGTNAAYGGFGFAVDPAYMPWRHSNPTYSPRDDATVAIGRHTLDFGFLAIIAQRNEINPPVGANTGDIQGLVNFSNLNNFDTTGNTFADFLRGGIRSFQQDSAQLLYHNNYTIWEPYIQDDFHVTKRLTLNLGLRLSLFGLWHETNHNAYNWVQSAFSPTLASQVVVSPFNGSLQLLGAGGAPAPLAFNPTNIDPHILNGIVQCTNGTCMKGHLVNPAPRIGFAWDPFGTGKTSIRGGYGIFYEHGVGNEANTGSLEGSPTNFPNGVVDASQNIPGAWNLIGSPSIGGFPAAYPINVTSIPSKVQWPYVQQWSLSVEHNLPYDSLGTIAYVASKGTHLTAELNLNQLQPIAAAQNPFKPGEPLNLITCASFSGETGSFTIFDQNNNATGTVQAGTPAFTNLSAACYGTPAGATFPDPNSLREFAPGVGNIYALRNVANSTYQAFQFTLKRTKGPLTIGLSYSYSHSLDDASDRTDPVLNSFDLRENHASSNFDERHLFNLDYVWDIPVARLLNAFLFETSDSGPTGLRVNADSHEKLLKGWQLSGITLYASGTPFSVINGGSSSGTSFPDNAGVASGAMVGTTPVESYPDIIRNVPGKPLVPQGAGQGATEGPLLADPFLFTAPQGLTFGDAGRNFLNNPSRLNFDISLLKNFKTSEGTSLQFRLESFNTFNHTQFRIYDPSRPGIPGNNVITCYDQSSGVSAFTAGGDSCLAGNSFLHPIDAHRPRTVQLGVKFQF